MRCSLGSDTPLPFSVDIQRDGEKERKESERRGAGLGGEEGKEGQGWEEEEGRRCRVLLSFSAPNPFFWVFLPGGDTVTGEAWLQKLKDE